MLTITAGRVATVAGAGVAVVTVDRLAQAAQDGIAAIKRAEVPILAIDRVMHTFAIGA